MENITITDMEARIAELEAEAAEVRRMAQAADNYADQCETPEGENILRSEASNLWFCVGEFYDRIERMHRTVALMSAAMV